MALERPPKYLALNPDGVKSYRPPDSEVNTWHTVGRSGKEGWFTLQEKYKVPAARIIQFNFPGAAENGKVVSEIVNWYLHFHNGFNCPETVDHKNRRFKGGEKVAIPFLGSVEIGEVVIRERLKPTPNVWFGGGYTGGTTFVLAGIETAQMVCVSSDGKTGFTATVSGTRFPAFGWGASGGPFVILITSMKSPRQLSGLMTGGTDYSLALGVKLNAVFGDARTAKAMEALSNFATRYGKAGVNGLKAGKELVKFNSQIVSAVKLLGMKLDHYEPQMYSLGIPWGGFGAEVSVHFTVKKFHVESIVNLLRS